jgi:hypothetical protein
VFRQTLHSFADVQRPEDDPDRAGYCSHSDVPIDEEQVRRSLYRLRSPSNGKTDSPLEHLLLVDLLLLDPAFPSGPNNRPFAWEHLLTSLLRDRLARHRATYDLAPPHEAEHFQAAPTAIARDAQIGNVELLGWSWLYSFFVRTDLNLTQERFADLIHVDGRSVRRYQRYAIQHLTNQLIEQGWQARKDQRRHRLCAAVPRAKPIRLVGREAALAQAGWLLNPLDIHHLQVNGAPGIGKTRLVQAVMRAQIEAERYTTILWIDRPGTVAALEQRFTDQLRLHERHRSLRDYLSLHRVAVVLDDLAQLNTPLEAIEALLNDLSEATVILVNGQPLPLHAVTARIHLDELEGAEAFRLIQRLLQLNFRTNREPLSEDEIEWVWQRARGNPQAIQRAVYTLWSEAVS